MEENSDLRSRVKALERIHLEYAQSNTNTVENIVNRASAPEALVQLILERLKQLGVSSTVELEGEDELLVFKMPSELAS